jgi:hypothetical protein
MFLFQILVVVALILSIISMVYASKKGTKGARGRHGNQGNQGIQGNQGLQGSTGNNGFDGPNLLVPGTLSVLGEGQFSKFLNFVNPEGGPVAGQCTLGSDDAIVRSQDFSPSNLVFLSRYRAFGTPGIISIANAGHGGFRVVSSEPDDVSIVNWLIIKTSV